METTVAFMKTLPNLITGNISDSVLSFMFTVRNA